VISPETIAIIQTIIYLACIGGVVYWARQWFTALNSAIAAQKTTIEAQKTLMDGMATFLNTMHVPVMAKRFEDYKKLVDREKDALVRQAEEDFKKENQALVQASNTLENRLMASESSNQVLKDHVVLTRIELASMYKLNPQQWELAKARLPPPLLGSMEKILAALPQPAATAGEVLREVLYNYWDASRKKNHSDK